jgi:hypothetical protein
MNLTLTAWALLWLLAATTFCTVATAPPPKPELPATPEVSGDGRLHHKGAMVVIIIDPGVGEYEGPQVAVLP